MILSKAKKDIFTDQTSLHLSKKKGEGYDFAELNIYQYGDDAKKIDWKSFARTQTPHIKNYFQEKEANIALVPILSPTLKFKEKLQTFYEACSLIGFGVIKEANRVSVNIINGDEMINFHPSKDINIVEKSIKTLSKLKPKNTPPALSMLEKSIKKNSLLVLVGDFLDLVDLKHLSQKHEILIIIIRDGFEEEPTVLGEREFVDLQTAKSKILFFGKKELKEWQEGYQRADRKLYSYLNSLAISYLKVRSDRDLLKQLKI